MASKQRINTELLIGIAAIILSIVSLVVSIFQTQIARQQQHASVWPYLQLSTAFTEGPSSGFVLGMVNNGVGPALLKQVTITYQGRVYVTLHQPLLAQIKQAVSDTTTYQLSWHELKRGMVIKAGEERMAFQLTGSYRGSRSINQMVTDTSFHLRIVYSDVYGNCWQVDQDQVSAVASLPAN